MAQEQVQPQKKTTTTTEEAPVVEPQDVKNEELDQDVADVLDEIDDVLESNAEAFVAQYVQRGGE